jgi:hypothetical protein
MRNLIDILDENNSPLAEKREQYFGIAYWVSPSGNIVETDSEHADWVRDHAQMLGLNDHQVASEDDAVYNAIQKGWSRVVVQKSFTGISANNLDSVRKSVRSLMRNRMDDRTTNLEVDVYGADPYHPIIIHTRHPMRRWLPNCMKVLAAGIPPSIRARSSGQVSMTPTTDISEKSIPTRRLRIPISITHCMFQPSRRMR